MPHADPQLIERARSGDAVAFEQVVSLHQAEIKSYLYRMTACREDAEDLSQEVWTRVSRKLDTFESRANFRTWLFSIATNLARDHHRARQRWPADAQDKAKALAESSPEYAEEFLRTHRTAEHSRYEIREHIDFCFTCIMKTLPLEQHVTVMLADVYGFTNTEAAEVLGVTVGVLKHLLHDARSTMDRIFEHRCALINKHGVCHQCSELNGFFNPQQDQHAALAKLDLVRATRDAKRRNLLALRTELVRGFDPLNANGTAVQETIMRVVRKANGETIA